VRVMAQPPSRWNNRRSGLLAVRKSNAPKKRVAWNKGIEVGQRAAFTPQEVKRIKAALAKQGDKGLRDLALFSAAIDTMLHSVDLL
jgi:hypothetical protein